MPKLYSDIATSSINVYPGPSDYGVMATSIQRHDQSMSLLEIYENTCFHCHVAASTKNAEV